MPTLKLHSNRLLHSNTVIGTLAVDEWAVTFGTARRGLGGLEPRPVPSSLAYSLYPCFLLLPLHNFTPGANVLSILTNIYSK